MTRSRYTYVLVRDDGSRVKLTAFYSPEEWVARLAEHLAWDSITDLVITVS